MVKSVQPCSQDLVGHILILQPLVGTGAEERRGTLSSPKDMLLNLGRTRLCKGNVGKIIRAINCVALKAGRRRRGGEWEAPGRLAGSVYLSFWRTRLALSTVGFR